MRIQIVFIVIFFLIISGCNRTNEEVMTQHENSESTTNLIEKRNDTKQEESKKMGGFISNYHPIVFKSSFLGGVDILLGGYNQRWLSAKEITNYIKGKEEYKLYSLNKFLGVGLGGIVISPNSFELDAEKIKIKCNLQENEEALAISCDWNALPRIPIQQNSSNEVYKKILSKLLEDNGLNNIPINIVQNCKVDLEGDGQDEVLLYAENIEPVSAKFRKNNYSMLILRKIINGKVENIFLQKDIHLKDGNFSDECPKLLNIKAIADLNGDGVMEILVEYKFYEGFGYYVFELKDNQAKLVLSNGIGA